MNALTLFAGLVLLAQVAFAAPTRAEAGQDVPNEFGFYPRLLLDFSDISEEDRSEMIRSETAQKMIQRALAEQRARFVVGLNASVSVERSLTMGERGPDALRDAAAIAQQDFFNAMR